jgi:peptide deformylase
MDPYDVIMLPDPVLKTEAVPVARVDDKVRAQMDRMLATMYEAKGIGLAANQVGLLNRVLVMDLMGATWQMADEENGAARISRVEPEYPEQAARKPVVMANPEIVWRAEQRSVYEEGCLSIPGHWGDVVRPAEVKVKYLDYHGNPQELTAEGLFAHCVQHEIDHLNGVLFIDYLSKLRRDMIVRKMEKLKKQQGG